MNGTGGTGGTGRVPGATGTGTGTAERYPAVRPCGSYAVAHLLDVRPGPDIERYLLSIEETMAPYGGCFLVHGASARAVEGQWSGDLVVLGFPGPGDAEAWYRSPAYQAIVGLRTRNSRGLAVLVEGVPAGHRATDVLEQLR
ncbi:DUF1330 domain-containing protein [Kineococcus sp. T13]|nr:DUF1330 domain-containing protein [Kineococcus vitellinus]NAZ75949.1 DUF1330 domain-containing protein [Kineococcus vitellinus]